MDAKIRFAISVLAAAALSAMIPLLAFAEEPVPPSVTVQPPSATAGVTVTGGSASVTTTGSTTTVTTTGTGATATTTGTTATGTVPSTTATTGGPIVITSPDTSGVSTGSGTTTATGSAPITGPGVTGSTVTASTGPTGGSSPAAGSADGGAAIGTDPAVNANDPVTKTSANAGARAHVVLCLLAQWSVQPSQAVLSSLCDKGSKGSPGSDDGASLDGSNGIAGTAVDSNITVRAAVCLLGLVSSPAPSSHDTSGVANASLSSLCGSGPSTASVIDDSSATSSRTGTSASAGPVVSAAACLLANGVFGTMTAAEIATTCAPLSSPTTVSGSSPLMAHDNTTGTTADLAPAANAAACLLVNALASVPDDASKASAKATLDTSCTTPPGKEPTVGSVVLPTTGSSGGPSGPSIDLAPAANAALCILGNADLAASGASGELSGVCGTGAPAGNTGGNPGGNPGGTTGGGPGGNPGGTTGGGPGGNPGGSTGGGPGGTTGGTNPGGPSGEAGGNVGTGGAQPGGTGTTGPGGATTPGGTGSVTAPSTGNGPAGGAVNGIQLTGLPSTSTAAAGGGALIAILAAMAVAFRRRRD